jgi:hypothetical protein
MKQIKLLFQEYFAMKLLSAASKVAPKEMSTDILLSSYAIIGRQSERISNGD